MESKLFVLKLKRERQCVQTLSEQKKKLQQALAHAQKFGETQQTEIDRLRHNTRMKQLSLVHDIPLEDCAFCLQRLTVECIDAFKCFTCTGSSGWMCDDCIAKRLNDFCHSASEGFVCPRCAE